MRAAICLRGAMSHLQGGHLSNNCNMNATYVPFESVKKSIDIHLRDVNTDTNFDVFIHSWNPDLQNDLNILYKPKDGMYEDNALYKNDITSNMIGTFNNTSQQLSICKSLQLMNTYANEHNIKYDYVISCRLDVLIFKDIDLKSYDASSVYVNDNVRADFRFIMNHENALKLMTIYGKSKQFHQYMKLIPDNLKHGKHEEVLRKILTCSIRKHKIPISLFYKYGLNNDQIQKLTHCKEW
jgi:hypothetical protein